MNIKITKTLKNGTVKTKEFKVRDPNSYNELSQIYRTITGKWFKRTELDMRNKYSKLDAIQRRLQNLQNNVTEEAKVDDFDLTGAL